jgi:hypothetical protein
LCIVLLELNESTTGKSLHVILYLIIIIMSKCLYSSPDIIRQIKSRRMRWARHVARMGEGRNLNRVLVGKAEGERDHLKDQGVDGRVGSKWALERLAGGVWCGFTWLRIGIVGGLL